VIARRWATQRVRAAVPESSQRPIPDPSANVRVVPHPMENGFRVDSQGTTIPLHIITDFVCSYDGAEVFHVRLEPGLSANPTFSFFIRATKSGRVDFLWQDQDGTITKATASIEVT
jgi:sulfur-oxidizing protein SoxZ